MFERNWTPKHLPDEGTSPREEAAGTWPLAVAVCSGLVIPAGAAKDWLLANPEVGRDITIAIEEKRREVL